MKTSLHLFCIVSLVCITGCMETNPDITSDTSNGNPENVGTVSPEPTLGDVVAGKTQYDAMCASCHGPDVVGSSPIAVNAYNFESMSRMTALTMPVGNPGACVDECADNVTAYIFNGYSIDTIDPSPTPTPTPQVLPSSTPVPEITPSPSVMPTPIPVTTSPPSPSVTPTPSITPSPDQYERGVAVYEISCAVCHNPIEVTNQRGASAEDIADAIVNVRQMRNLVLTQQQLDDVGFVLTSLSPIPSPTPTPNEPVDCSDMQELMTSPELNCTHSSCHSASPSQGAKIALTGTIDDIALRLGNVDSVSSNCGGEKVIDLSNPSNSLLLKIIDPDSGTQCAQKMPIGSMGVSPEHFQCFQQWVDDIVTLAEVPVEPTVEPFEAVPPLSALNKTKGLLHGGAVTEVELAAVSPSGTNLDQAALKTQIEQWMLTAEFETKFKSFLQLALQQKNVNPDTEFRNQFDVINNNRVISGTKLIENIESSFVRTAFKLFENNQDFRRIAVTRDWEVTTALLLALSYADYQNRLPFGREAGNSLREFTYLCGDNDGGDVDETEICAGIDDYADWRTVTMVQGSDQANFEFTQGMIDSLRAVPNGGSYAFLAPRVGFFTTPAFFQSWESNTGNQFRVTANQAMIVGLGLTFEAGDVTPSGDLTALDEEHAGEDNPECYACHRMLDPMTQAFDNAYHVSRSRALTNPKNIPAAFAFHGGDAVLNTLDDLGQAIFDHPNFAKGWVGKLCNWATSAPCDTTSDEFLRLVDVFKSNNYRLKPLVVELFASPLVTGIEYIDAFEDGAPSVVLNRTNHFCKSMEARLNQVRASRGLAPSIKSDICNVSGTARNKAALLPQDEFSRGSIDLIQSVNVDPFLTSGFRQMCESVGTQIIAFGAGTEGSVHYDKIFDANQVSRSLDEMTTYVMGIPESLDEFADARAGLQKLYDIHRHSTSCVDAGLDVIEANKDSVVCGFKAANNAVALRQVWTFACSSPSVMSVGF